MNWAYAPTEPGYYWLIHTYQRSSDVPKLVEILKSDKSPNGWRIASRAEKFGLHPCALYYGPMRPPTPPGEQAMESIRRDIQRSIA